MSITLFYDLETTGTDFEKSAVVQIGAILDKDGDILRSLNLKIKPHPGANIDQGALDAIGMTIEDLMEDPERLDHLKAYREFVKFCGFIPGARILPSHRIHRAGYNILAFDNPMLSALGAKAGDNYTFAKFHWPGIDVASIACAVLRKERRLMKDFKLMTVAKQLGISTEGQAHDALFDVGVTRAMYYKILEKDNVPREF